MNTIWIPIAFTLIFAYAVWCDYKACADISRLPSWWQVVIGLLINPGVALIAIWWLWVLLK